MRFLEKIRVNDSMPPKKQSSHYVGKGGPMATSSKGKSKPQGLAALYSGPRGLDAHPLACCLWEQYKPKGKNPVQARDVSLPRAWLL